MKLKILRWIVHDFGNGYAVNLFRLTKVVEHLFRETKNGALEIAKELLSEWTDKGLLRERSFPVQKNTFYFPTQKLLALYAGDFGFTAEDVEELRETYYRAIAEVNPHYIGEDGVVDALMGSGKDLSRSGVKELMRRFEHEDPWNALVDIRIESDGSKSLRARPPLLARTLSFY